MNMKDKLLDPADLVERSIVNLCVNQCTNYDLDLKKLEPSLIKSSGRRLFLIWSIILPISVCICVFLSYIYLIDHRLSLSNSKLREKREFPFGLNIDFLKPKDGLNEPQLLDIDFTNLRTGFRRMEAGRMCRVNEVSFRPYFRLTLLRGVTMDGKRNSTLPLCSDLHKIKIYLRRVQLAKERRDNLTQSGYYERIGEEKEINYYEDDDEDDDEDDEGCRSVIPSGCARPTTCDTPTGSKVSQIEEQYFETREEDTMREKIMYVENRSGKKSKSKMIKATEEIGMIADEIQKPKKNNKRRTTTTKKPNQKVQVTEETMFEEIDQNNKLKPKLVEEKPKPEEPEKKTEKQAREEIEETEDVYEIITDKNGNQIETLVSSNKRKSKIGQKSGIKTKQPLGLPLQDVPFRVEDIPLKLEISDNPKNGPTTGKPKKNFKKEDVRVETKEEMVIEERQEEVEGKKKTTKKPKRKTINPTIESFQEYEKPFGIQTKPAIKRIPIEEPKDQVSEFRTENREKIKQTIKNKGQDYEAPVMNGAEKLKKKQIDDDKAKSTKRPKMKETTTPVTENPSKSKVDSFKVIKKEKTVVKKGKSTEQPIMEEISSATEEPNTKRPRKSLTLAILEETTSEIPVGIGVETQGMPTENPNKKKVKETIATPDEDSTTKVPQRLKPKTIKQEFTREKVEQIAVKRSKSLERPEMEETSSATEEPTTKNPRKSSPLPMPEETTSEIPVGIGFQTTEMPTQNPKEKEKMEETATITVQEEEPTTEETMRSKVASSKKVIKNVIVEEFDEDEPESTKRPKMKKKSPATKEPITTDEPSRSREGSFEKEFKSEKVENFVVKKPKLPKRSYIKDEMPEPTSTEDPKTKEPRRSRLESFEEMIETENVEQLDGKKPKSRKRIKKIEKTSPQPDELKVIKPRRSNSETSEEEFTSDKVENFLVRRPKRPSSSLLDRIEDDDDLNPAKRKSGSAKSESFEMPVLEVEDNDDINVKRKGKRRKRVRKLTREEEQDEEVRREIERRRSTLSKTQVQGVRYAFEITTDENGKETKRLITQPKNANFNSDHGSDYNSDSLRINSKKLRGSSVSRISSFQESQIGSNSSLSSNRRKSSVSSSDFSSGSSSGRTLNQDYINSSENQKRTSSGSSSGSEVSNSRKGGSSSGSKRRSFEESNSQEYDVEVDPKGSTKKPRLLKSKKSSRGGVSLINLNILNGGSSGSEEPYEEKSLQDAPTFADDDDESDGRNKTYKAKIVPLKVKGKNYQVVKLDKSKRRQNQIKDEELDETLRFALDDEEVSSASSSGSIKMMKKSSPSQLSSSSSQEVMTEDNNKSSRTHMVMTSIKTKTSGSTDAENDSKLQNDIKESGNDDQSSMKKMKKNKKPFNYARQEVVVVAKNRNRNKKKKITTEEIENSDSDVKLRSELDESLDDLVESGIEDEDEENAEEVDEELPAPGAKQPINYEDEEDKALLKSLKWVNINVGSTICAPNAQMMKTFTCRTTTTSSITIKEDADVKPLTASMKEDGKSKKKYSCETTTSSTNFSTKRPTSRATSVPSTISTTMKVIKTKEDDSDVKPLQASLKDQDCQVKEESCDETTTNTAVQETSTCSTKILTMESTSMDGKIKEDEKEKSLQSGLTTTCATTTTKKTQLEENLVKIDNFSRAESMKTSMSSIMSTTMSSSMSTMIKINLSTNKDEDDVKPLESSLEQELSPSETNKSENNDKQTSIEPSGSPSSGSDDQLDGKFKKPKRPTIRKKTRMFNPQSIIYINNRPDNQDYSQSKSRGNKKGGSDNGPASEDVDDAIEADPDLQAVLRSIGYGSEETIDDEDGDVSDGGQTKVKMISPKIIKMAIRKE